MREFSGVVHILTLLWKHINVCHNSLKCPLKSGYILLCVNNTSIKLMLFFFFLSEALIKRLRLLSTGKGYWLWTSGLHFKVRGWAAYSSDDPFYGPFHFLREGGSTILPGCVGMGRNLSVWVLGFTQFPSGLFFSPSFISAPLSPASPGFCRAAGPPPGVL